MNYTFRRVHHWVYELVRHRDKKVVARLVKGSGWHVFSADSKKIIALDIAHNLDAAKKEFLVIAKKRRGRF